MRLPKSNDFKLKKQNPFFVDLDFSLDNEKGLIRGELLKNMKKNDEWMTKGKEYSQV